MRCCDLDAALVWRLHLASGCRLGGAVVRGCDAGLQVHLVATRTVDGTRSVTVLGINPRDGTTRSYQEVELRDGEEAQQVHEQLRLDDVVEGARQTLRRADAALDAVREGKPVPGRQSPKGAS